jgi:hypothetical protein
VTLPKQVARHMYASVLNAPGESASVTPDTGETNVVLALGTRQREERATRLSCNLHVPGAVVASADLDQNLKLASAGKFSLRLA